MGFLNILEVMGVEAREFQYQKWKVHTFIIKYTLNMKVKYIYKIIIIFLFCGILTSCYTTQLVSAQDDYQKACVGLTKYEIKNNFGIPDRVVYDTELGEIFIYEKFYTTTSGYSKTSASADAYATYGVHANGRSTTNEHYSTINERAYIEFYFREGENKCYNVRTNEKKSIRVKDEWMTKFTIGMSVGGTLGLILITVISFVVAL